MQHSPFNLNDLNAYQAWRTKKLSAYPLPLDQLFTPIHDPENPSTAELQRLQTTCRQHNLALYRFMQGDLRSKRHVHRLGQKVGLLRLDNNLCADEDSLTSLHVTSHAGQHDYIPYTNKPLSWHTDGYYNLPEQQIHGMVLHCAQPALAGGESWLMDHEIAYILLRDANPDYIHALMHPNAFTIPANVLNGEIIRPEQSGPVFSVTAAGHLHMRYSARQRNVIWRDDPMTREAADFLLNLWQQDSPYKIRYTLQAGEGLLCNNVLHNRTAFKDSDDPTQTRLLYRGRYFDRVEEPLAPAPSPLWGHPSRGEEQTQGDNMLSLSQILMVDGDKISNFEELKQIVQQRALETGSIFFQIDIEPPGYKDRPDDWYDQLEITFSSAR